VSRGLISSERCFFLFGSVTSFLLCVERIEDVLLFGSVTFFLLCVETISSIGCLTYRSSDVAAALMMKSSSKQ
jgi:hypothetical protein